MLIWYLNVCSYMVEVKEAYSMPHVMLRVWVALTF